MMKMTMTMDNIRTSPIMISTTIIKSRKSSRRSNSIHERLLSNNILFLIVFLHVLMIQMMTTTTIFVSSFMIISKQQRITRTSSLYDYFLNQQQPNHSLSSTTQLYAAKQRSSDKKGFGKQPQQVEKVERVIEQQDNNNNEQRSILSSLSSNQNTMDDIYQNNQNNQNNIMLTSIDDSKLSVEERTAAILREKYNLKTIEEQQMDIKQYAIYKDEQKKKKEWIKKLKEDEDFDIMTVIPPSILQGIDTILKVLLTICSIIFILFGLLITVEAYTKATNQFDLLSNDIHNIIVNTIEPNFTTLFIILLSCSISLGIFSLLQLGSSSATYREK